MSQRRSKDFIYIPFLQERVEHGKNRESFPSAIFHPERKPATAVSTWAPSDSAAQWKLSLRPHCLFYESAEKVFASRNIISTGHLCISGPLATPGGFSGKKHHCLQRAEDSQKATARVGFKTGNNGCLEIITSPFYDYQSAFVFHPQSASASDASCSWKIDEEEMQEATAGLAAAKGVSMDTAVVVFFHPD